jgi:RNase P/RNase MRP subunit p30
VKHPVDLHLCPQLHSPSHTKLMIEKAVELGYKTLGMPFPARYSKEEIEAVGELCSKLGVDLVTRVDLAPKTVGELLKNLRFLRRRAEVVAVNCFSKAVARQAAKDRRVDLLSFPSPSPRSHFFDHAEAELASGALAALEIEMAPLLRLQGFRRCLLLSTLRKEIRVAKKAGVPVILSSGADEPYLLRHFEDYASLSYLFGMDLHAAKKAFSDNPQQLIERNRRKLSPNFVAPGIYIVRRGKNCLKV